jgi:serine/threonine-protein kinase
MAPEQIASTRDADARSDQYALGVILYECVTGRPAFRGDNVYAVLKVVGDGTFDRPSKHRADLPATFEAVILRAMAHDPAARYPTLHDLARALLPFASERSRVTWGVVFDPGGTRGPSPSVPPLDAAPLPPRTDVGHIGDTLVDAAQVRDTSAIPLERRRSRAPALIAALAVAGLVSAAAAFTLSRPSTPAPVPHPLTTALTRPDAATPPPTVVQPAPPAATPASLAAAPVQAAPPPRIRQPQGVRRPRRAVRSMTDILNTAP